MANKMRLSICSVFFVLACGLPGHANMLTRPYKGALSVIFENDILTGSDNNYTNGIGFSWSANEAATYHPGGFVPKWVDFWSFLPGMARDETHNYAAWTLAQQMHTPSDIKDPDPPENDQPYAGVLYVDSVIYTRSEHWGQAWSLRLGLVGPSSQAESVQKQAHNIFGAEEPQGWQTQLPDEPIINVGYTAGYLWLDGELSGPASWRIIPNVNAELGNYATALGTGVYAEVGRNLSDALGRSSLGQGVSSALTIGGHPQETWAVSVLGGISGYAVAHYLPLDGTVFHSSRSVDSNPFVGMITGGVSLRNKRFVFSMSTTFFTETYENQDHAVDYGTLVMAWYF